MVQATEEIPGLKIRASELHQSVVTRDGIIDTLTAERDGQLAARKQAEEAARHAIDELAKSGNAPAIVSALNERLQALSRLSGVPTAAATEDRQGDGAVHGRPAASDGADDPGSG